VCVGNDLALVELSAEAVEAAHPAVRFYGGPTSVLPGPDLKANDEIHMYGNSEARSVYSLIDTDATNPHDGKFLRYDNGGWTSATQIIPSSIQGDSGAGLLGPHGEAHGVLSGGSLTYTEDYFTDLAWALWYMQVHVGWSPSVVTWPDFDAAGIEPA
jgi:hypothetical protein